MKIVVNEVNNWSKASSESYERRSITNQGSNK
jgi:hypothetical protein